MVTARAGGRRDGGPINCGRFLPGEAPDETAQALLAFPARAERPAERAAPHDPGYTAHSAERASACSSTVRVAFSCLSGG